MPSRVVQKRKEGEETDAQGEGAEAAMPAKTPRGPELKVAAA